MWTITRAWRIIPAAHPPCSQGPDDDDDQEDCSNISKDLTCGPLVLSWTGGRGVCPSWAGTRPSNLSNIALIMRTIAIGEDDIIGFGKRKHLRWWLCGVGGMVFTLRQHAWLVSCCCRFQSTSSPQESPFVNNILRSSWKPRSFELILIIRHRV